MRDAVSTRRGSIFLSFMQSVAFSCKRNQSANRPSSCCTPCTSAPIPWPASWAVDSSQDEGRSSSACCHIWWRRKRFFDFPRHPCQTFLRTRMCDWPRTQRFLARFAGCCVRARSRMSAARRLFRRSWRLLIFVMKRRRKKARRRRKTRARSRVLFSTCLQLSNDTQLVFSCPTGAHLGRAR